MNINSISTVYAFIFVFITIFTSAAQADSETDLTDIPLESLLEIQVTSVSKKSQSLTNAAAAVFVITQDDIKRSGVTTIVDALRMVPGVQVARIDSNKWAVSSRGFNGRFANKLLVLMDGRSLYTPFFIGVYWEAQDTLLDDIERIEVIRGPGAALWGANAVNGVINIITKSAENSNGTLISTGTGTNEKGFISARNGFAINDNSGVRFYVKHNERENFVYESGRDSNDEWHKTQGGFRYDIRPSSDDTITLQGDYYDGRLSETYHLYNISPPDYQQYINSNTAISGGNITSRWQRNYSESSRSSLQFYYDHTERDMLVSPQKFNTIDIDFQHRFAPSKFQDVVWGAAYRFSQYTVVNTQTLSFNENSVGNNLSSAFVHDEISILPNRLFLIIGSRFEHSDIAGSSIQPNGRLLWAPTPHTSVWGSISRAVRSKTKGEEDISYNYRTIPPQTPQNSSSIPLRLEIVGNSGFKSEEVISYEAGSRTELLQRLFADVALYYSRYNNLRVISPGVGYAEPSQTNTQNMVQPYYLSNDMYGHSAGAEIALEWTPLDWWRIQSAYSYQKFKMYLKGTSIDIINKGNAEGGTPSQQLSLRSGFDLSRQIKLDLWLRGVGHLDSIDGKTIPGYITADVRFAWKPQQNIELAVVAQNILQNHHPEFIPEYINTLPSETVRSGYAKITWKF
ncbi:MAG: TonB-dependent receptor [Desulfuromonadaceae bacterium]|nr:TonB-dependent receptor [Desulfuromonadaceae bacterium]MDD2855076.1 TonB-dependent receptor [Desulfuromonadaceae bacterium]